MQGGVVLIEPVLGEASPSHRNPCTGEGNDAGLKKPAWFLLATTLMMCFVLLSCVDKNYQTLNKGEKKKVSLTLNLFVHSSSFHSPRLGMRVSFGCYL